MSMSHPNDHGSRSHPARSISLKRATLALITKNQIARVTFFNTAASPASKPPNALRADPALHPLKPHPHRRGFADKTRPIEITATARIAARPASKWNPHSVAVAALTIYDMCKAVDKR